MAARLTVWSNGDVLTAGALNAEFDNILNNGVNNANIDAAAAISASKLDLTDIAIAVRFNNAVELQWENSGGAADARIYEDAAENLVLQMGDNDRIVFENDTGATELYEFNNTWWGSKGSRELRVYDGDNSDYLALDHDGTNAVFSTTTGLILFEGSGGGTGYLFDTDTGADPVWVSRTSGTGQALKLYTDDNNVWFESVQDEANNGGFVFIGDSDGSGAVEGASREVMQFRNLELHIYDNAVAQHTRLYQSNAGNFHINQQGPVGGDIFITAADNVHIRDGGDFRVNEPGNTKNLILSHDNTVGEISTANGDDIECTPNGGDFKVNGDIEYTGSISDVSDKREKENIEEMNGSLATLKELRPVRYTVKGDEAGSVRTGLIAQEAEAHVPEAIKEPKESDGAEGRYRMDYTRLVAYLIGGIQELEARVAELEA